jgi:predicted PolB exonuclease-like 3'-5' exonuclease
MIIACFDIETIPDQNIPPECLPILDLEDVKYGNAKDPVKRQAILEEKQADFETNKIKSMSLTPGLAQVCTFVGMKYDTETELFIKESIQVTKEYNGDDLEAITEGWGFIQKAYMERIPLVSFNGIGFDLPILWHRAMIQDIPVDPFMYARLTPRYGGPFHYDLLGILAGWTIDKMKGKNLNFFLNRFKLGNKTDGMDGSKVYEAWQLGEYQKIQEYCENDVLMTCKLFQRVEPWIKQSKIEKEEL